MSWTKKQKNSLNPEFILTPDEEEILVGENEDELLIYALATGAWTLLSKNNTSWDSSSKLLTTYYMAFQNGDQVITQNEDLLYAYKEITRNWSLKQKVI